MKNWMMKATALLSAVAAAVTLAPAASASPFPFLSLVTFSALPAPDRLLPAPPIGDRPIDSPDWQRKELFFEINRRRMAAGRPALQWNETANADTQNWAGAQAEANRLMQAGSFYNWEMVSWAYEPDRSLPARFVNNWQVEFPHNIMLMGSWRSMTTGVAQSPNGRLYSVVRFYR